MAIIHRADVTPSKQDLVSSWLDRQPWGGSGALLTLGSYRFDDPDGEVGVEAILVRRAGRVLHVPMAYRGEPLDGAEAHLIGTMDHSVLGPRWVDEAGHDPVAVACFSRALSGLQEQAVLEVYDGDELVDRREPEVLIHRERRERDSENAPGHLRFAQVLGADLGGSERLVATWSDGQAVVAVR